MMSVARRHSSTFLALGCLAVAAASASAQPFPSFMVDTTRVIGSASPTACRQPRAAFGPRIGFVGWANRYPHAAGTRLTRDMQPMDTIPIDLSTRDLDCYTYRQEEEIVDVASSPSGFCALWLSWDRLMVTIVDTAGTVRRRIELHHREAQPCMYAIASDSESYYAVWTLFTGEQCEYELWYARLSLDGDIIQRSLIATCEDPESYAYPDVAPYGAGVAVVWWHPGGVLGKLLPLRSLPDTVGFSILCDTGPGTPKIAFDGSRFFVGLKARSGVQDSFDLRVFRVAQSGVVLDSEAITPARDIDDFQIVALPDTVLVVWSERMDTLWTVSARRISGAGQILDSVPIALRSAGLHTSEPWVAVLGDTFACGWRAPMDPEWPYWNFEVQARRVTCQGAVIDSDTARLSHGVDDQVECDVASNGRRFLAVWGDCFTDTLIWGEVRARLLDSAGNADAPAFPVGPPCRSKMRPVVAYGSGCYLVVWAIVQSSRAVKGGWVLAARVSPEGVLIDSVPLVIEERPEPYLPQRADVSYSNGIFLVVWEDDRGPFAKRVTPEGVVLDTTPISPFAMVNHYRPRTAGGANCHVIVAFDWWNRLRAAKVLNDGRVAGVVLIDEGDPASERSPRIAYGADLFLVVDPYSQAAYRLTENLEVLDTISFYGYRIFVHTPLGVAFDGVDFAVCYALQTQHRDSARLFKVEPGGRLPMPSPVTLATLDEGYFDFKCELAQAGDRMLAVFESFEPGEYMSMRIRGVPFAALGICEPKPGPDQLPASLSVRPNPASDYADACLYARRAGTIELQLYDMAGRCRLSRRLDVTGPGLVQTRIATSTLPQGVYVLRAEPGNQSVKLAVTGRPTPAARSINDVEEGGSGSTNMNRK